MLEVLKQFYDAVVRFVSDQLATLFATLATLLSTTLTSSFAVYKLDWFGVQLGAVVGVAQVAMILVTVVVGLFLIGQPFATHTNTTGRLFSSIWMLSLFVVVFYAVVDVVIFGSLTFGNFMIAVVTSQKQPDFNKVMDSYLTLIPGLAGVELILLVILAILGLLLWVVAIAIAIATIVVIIFYPLLVVLRPFGGLFEKLFHDANTVLVIAAVSPPFMTAALLLPVLVAKIPGIGNTPGQLIAAFIGLTAASLVPSYIAKRVHNRSVKTFGNVDAKVSNSVEGTWSDRGSGSISGASKAVSTVGFSSTLAVGIAGSAVTSKSPEQFVTKAKHAVANAAAVGLGLSGHAGLAAMVKTVDASAKSKEQKQGIAKATAAEILKTSNVTAKPATPPPPTIPRPPSP